jgi:uncharacterized damage-inducible protein DinB
MPLALTLNEFFEYTDWERVKWRDWLRAQGDQVLKTGAGPHGDGRFGQVGDVVRHIFSAEKRYAERLLDKPLTDVASIPNDNIDALFEFGQQSRKELKQLVEAFPAQEWDVPHEWNILTFSVTASPRKIVMHVLMHEIRHWAQIATLFRLNGLAVEFHDLLFSPVSGINP